MTTFLKDSYCLTDAHHRPPGTSVAKVEEKISKIKSLRDRAATEGERAAAEEALHRLKRAKSANGDATKRAANSTSESPSLRIDAAVENADCNESYYEVAFVDLDGNERKQLIERAKFYKPHKVVEVLAKSYAFLPDDSLGAVDLVRKRWQRKEIIGTELQQEADSLTRTPLSTQGKRLAS